MWPGFLPAPVLFPQALSYGMVRPYYLHSPFFFFFFFVVVCVCVCVSVWIYPGNGLKTYSKLYVSSISIIQANQLDSND